MNEIDCTESITLQSIAAKVKNTNYERLNEPCSDKY